ncbi:MAG: sigma-70 family RNA polymerase sigma factor [Armatimonadetes bacterium]|nr:sigma-70 family RNA polymerase sigma factor [Armatimonadota bacterium]
MLTPEDEAQLVRTAAQCDDTAFAALCHRYRRLLKRIATSFATTPEDCEDLQSEIVAKLLANEKAALRAWRPIASFMAYLSTIASRHCLLIAQRDGRLPTIPLTSALTEGNSEAPDILERLIPADHSDDPQALVERDEECRAVARAVTELSEIDQLILCMRFRDGMDGPTMASVLGITHGAVRQRIFKALRRLETILRERSPEIFDNIEAPD